MSAACVHAPGTRVGAGKWECAEGPTSSSFQSESGLCTVEQTSASQASETCAQDLFCSTEALLSSDEWISSSLAGCDSSTQLNAWRGAFYGDQQATGEDTAKLDLLDMIRCQMAVEQQVHPPRGFLEPHSQAAGQRDFLTPGMRMIVVSWMVEVAEEFRLQQETLHLAMGLLDRFLSSTEDVPRCVLQLLAVACMMLAAKDLEVSQPTVEQFCSVTANHFQPHDLLRMERIVLDVLEFRLSSPSSYTFLHLLAQACSSCVTPTVLSLAMYVCELAVLEYDMHLFTHSCRAIAALLLAQLSIGSAQHLPAVASTALSIGIPTEQLSRCMRALLRLQHAAHQHTVAAAAAAQAGRAGISTEIGDLLTPLRTKFGAGCWCEVSYVAPIAALPAPHIWAVY